MDTPARLRTDGRTDRTCTDTPRAAPPGRGEATRGGTELLRDRVAGGNRAARGPRSASSLGPGVAAGPSPLAGLGRRDPQPPGPVQGAARTGSVGPAAAGRNVPAGGACCAPERRGVPVRRPVSQQHPRRALLFRCGGGGGDGECRSAASGSIRAAAAAAGASRGRARTGLRRGEAGPGAVVGQRGGRPGARCRGGGGEGWGGRPGARCRGGAASPPRLRDVPFSAGAAMAKSKNHTTHNQCKPGPAAGAAGPGRLPAPGGGGEGRRRLRCPGPEGVGRAGAAVRSSTGTLQQAGLAWAQLKDNA